MDNAQKALRVDILLAGYTKALLKVERFRSQLLAYGVDPAYPSMRAMTFAGSAEQENEIHLISANGGSQRHVGQMPRTETESLMEQLKLDVDTEEVGPLNGGDNGTGPSLMDE
jgi:hypothetical protein